MKVLLLLSVFLLTQHPLYSQAIPLPEHPRPDFEREYWLNLNGTWDFEFDSLDRGVPEKWFSSKKSFSKKITVPFPWGCELSGVKDEADIAWYRRSIQIPKDWDRNKKVFLTIGASDWETTVWVDDQWVGSHQGGYMPFSFELPSAYSVNQNHVLTVRVDDKRRSFTLYGKQGYGNARGIWQTVYLESKGAQSIEAIRCIPDIDQNKVKIQIDVPSKGADQTIQVTLITPDRNYVEKINPKLNNIQHEIEFTLSNPRLWSLEDPYLYNIIVETKDDKVHSYFGMRKISVTKLPGTDIPYIALNNQPIYLQLALDQSYHPQGYYTFPSDAFMKDEIVRSKSIGLNGIRTHIKPDLPRKLYWADKLGLLVMADLPNSWGEPDAEMQQESEITLKEMIKRDFNHPSIFSWIVFNETWGLTTKVPKEGKTTDVYLPKTQQWVASMYHRAKSLDPTRLVEDNSICCGRGHTETDLYSWHEYLPGWAWEEHLAKIVKNNFPGSTYHFEQGFVQGNQPNINSECGNVWGYDGSTGDVDYSFDYHRMMNTFRKYPQIAGWLYTEHHDVINEWNGYWRFDRSNKYTGLEEIVPGMTLNDLHSTTYISTGNDIIKNVNGGEEVSIPLFLSNYVPKLMAGEAKLTYELWMTDRTCQLRMENSGNRIFPIFPYSQQAMDPLVLKMPDRSGVALLRLYLINHDGDTLHRNFIHFIIDSPRDLKNTSIISVRPDAFVNQSWGLKQWDVMDGLKVNGAGKGYFEYEIPVDKKLNLNNIISAQIILEASAKQLFDKDKDETFNKNQDYMLGSRVSPSKNPNAYPMTDDARFPSEISIVINGKQVMKTILADDPADHRGILSWNSQLKDRKLREAGSYGYLIKIPVTKSMLTQSKKNGMLKLKLQSINGGGLAIYGEKFGRYPVDINLVMENK